MEFTKGMTVKCTNGAHTWVVLVLGKGDSPTSFNGIELYPMLSGKALPFWAKENFHPFDLQSAIEEALKTNNHE